MAKVGEVIMAERSKMVESKSNNRSEALSSPKLAAFTGERSRISKKAASVSSASGKYNFLYISICVNVS